MNTGKKMPCEKKGKRVEPQCPLPEAALGDEEEAVDRGTWGNQCEFFLSCLGYAVGFGNVWRFPYLCYENGGAVFLIPYFVMLFCAGLPLFFMELALGQYISLGPNILFAKLIPLFSGLGWAMLAVSLFVAIYYNVILAWTLFYTFASFTSELGWSHCNNAFNSPWCATDELKKNCLNQSLQLFNNTCIANDAFCALGNFSAVNTTHCWEGNKTVPSELAVARISASEDYFMNRLLGITGRTWSDMGGLRWELVGCLALAWLIVYACMIKGVKSSGKVVYFTALFPYVVLVILLIRGLTLPGSYAGIHFYFLQPDVSKLATVKVWRDAATQIFYSLGSSFGGLITLASYNKFRNNCMRDAILIACSNCATSVFAGFVIFSILGFMATELGVLVEDVVKSGPGLAFIAYPEAVARMPGAPFWALLFFVMLITLGLDSQFTMVETLTTAIFDQFPFLIKRKPYVVAGMCIVLFLCGLTMVLEGGIYMFELFNQYSAGLSVVILATTELVLIQYVYGFKKFMHHIRKEIGITVPVPLYYYWTATWLVITPVLLCAILIMSFYYSSPAQYEAYIFPPAIQALGWIITFSSVVLIPIFGCFVIYNNRNNLSEVMRTSEDFCPAHIRKERELLRRKVPLASAYDNEAFAGLENHGFEGYVPYSQKDIVSHM